LAGITAVLTAISHSDVQNSTLTKSKPLQLITIKLYRI